MTHVTPRMERVCIVLMSALGDVVHALPLINAIKRQRPAAHITWVLQPAGAELVRGHPAVDDIVLFDRTRGLRAFTDVRGELRSRRFDLVLALQVYFKAGIVTALARADVKLGFDRARARDANWLFTNRRIPPRPVQHVQDQYFEFLEALGISSEPVVWNLGPWDHEREWQRQFFAQFERPVAAIVVATSKPEKDWPAQRWANVCDALWFEHGLQPVLVGGRSARELAAEGVIAAGTRGKPFSALGSGVRRLVSILDGAALVLSPDTGPLHMSVAVGTPVISLLGYTNPKRTGPYRDFHDLIIDAYGDPGETYAPSMENRAGRMLRIRPEDVLAKVGVWRARYAGAPRRASPAKS